MSWQPYIDTSLIGSGNFDRAAIFDREGKSCWATSTGFEVGKPELEKIIEALNETADVKSIMEKGLYVEGVKYIVLKADDRSIYGRKDKEGVVIVRTKQAIMLGHYPETVVAGTAASTMEALADYLISLAL